MAYVPLGGAEETHVVFEGSIPEQLADLGASEQEELLTKLLNVAEGNAPPDSYVYETIGNVDVLRFSSDGRAYSKVITHVPKGNTQYHVVYVLYIDADHEYDRAKLGKFSQRARRRLDAITSIESVENVESYLADHDSLTADDLKDLLRE